MRRDMDLVREILIYAAEKPDAKPSDYRAFGDHSADMVMYHIDLLVDAGLLDGVKGGLSDYGNSGFGIVHGSQIGNLTWDGQEFVAAAKDSTIWEKAMTHVVKPAAGFTFTAVLEYLKAEAKRTLGLGP